MVGVGAILLVLSCILPVFLALVGGSDLTVGLAFLCLFPLALIAMVTAIVISISRKEGRNN
jgi:hypothetical protein